MRANWSSRGWVPSVVFEIEPKAPALAFTVPDGCGLVDVAGVVQAWIVALGAAKFGVLVRLKDSARNCNCMSSLIGKFFAIAKSSCLCIGP